MVALNVAVVVPPPMVKDSAWSGLQKIASWQYC